MDLIRADEADAAKVDVISPQITSFSLEWAQIQVFPERFAAEATDGAHAVHVQNLVAGTFARLEHTPFSQMGLTWRAHFQMPSEEAWHALGDLLAPKAVWRKILTNTIRDGTPGMRTLVIEGRRKRKSEAEWTRVKVEPSIRMPHGAYIEIHEEYGKAKATDQHSIEDAQRLLGILRSTWSDFISDAQALAVDVLEWSRQEEPQS
jgi:hypothetical protein